MLFCTLPAFAQQGGISYDSASVQLRHVTGNRLSSFKSDPHFQYDKIVEPPVSLWDRFWNWIWSLIGRFFESSAGGVILNWLIIPVAVGIIVFFIIKVTGMTDGRLFRKKNLDQGLGFTTLDEDIHAIDFDSAIQRAVDSRNFRLAVRLLYLQSLKLLTDQGKINWQINKTNLAYWQELSGMPYQESFFELTRQFEYNWYGNWPPTETAFVDLRKTFGEFNRQL
jgi:hypothetical protein